MAKMNKLTPAREIRPKDLAANTEAIKNLIKTVPPSAVTNVVDIRYGLGGWAREVVAKFQPKSYLGYEQDEQTALASYYFNELTLIQGLYVPTEQQLPGVDLLLADFNNLTIMKRSELDEAIADFSPKLVIFTDVACSKLHLNYRSYGLRKPSLEAYWSLFEVPGYELRQYEKTHWAASTALYKRKRLP